MIALQEEICESLDEYNQQIATLKDEMEQLSKTSQKIEVDVKELPNRSLPPSFLTIDS